MRLENEGAFKVKIKTCRAWGFDMPDMRRLSFNTSAVKDKGSIRVRIVKESDWREVISGLKEISNLMGMAIHDGQNLLKAINISRSLLNKGSPKNGKES